MKAEAEEEARRWQQEQEAELKRKEAMKLSDQERLDILQVNNYPFFWMFFIFTILFDCILDHSNLVN